MTPLVRGRPIVEYGDHLTDLLKRVYTLEQGGKSGGNTFSEIVIVSGGGGTWPSYGTAYGGGYSNIVMTPISNPPTDLILTTTTFYDEVYVDISWTSPASLTASEYEIEFSKKVVDNYELQQIFRTAGNSIRIAGLEPLTTYGVRVFALNRLSVRSAALPLVGYQDITTTADSSLPGIPSNANAGAGLRSVTITWTEVTDRDVRRGEGLYEVWIATNNTFTTSVQTKLVSGEIVAFTNLNPNTTYYYKIIAQDSSGNQGSPTATGTVTTGQAGSTDISDGVITTDHIITAGLDAAVVKFGFMSGDRLVVNSLNANRLVTSDLVSADITLSGGSFRAGSPPTTGLLINSQGISLYGSGVRKIFLDALTGNGTFTGAISGSVIEGGSITGAVFKTNANLHTKRIEISTSVETIDSLAGNYFKMYAPTSGGIDPYRPGLLVSDINVSNVGLVQLTPPRPDSSYGSPALRLQSNNTGKANVLLGGSGCPVIQLVENGNIEFSSVTGKTNIASKLFAGTGGIQLAVPVMLNAGPQQSGGLPSVVADQFYFQTGSVVITTNGNGAQTVPFAIAFPNGCVTVVVSNGDTDARAELIGTTVVNATGFDATLEPNPGAGVNARVNYFAIGY